MRRGFSLSWLLVLVLAGALLLRWPAAMAAQITLTLPVGQAGTHRFYHQLLEESLKAAGHTVRVKTINDVPQPRLRALLEQGELSVLWMLQTPERDAQFVLVDHKLTQGLIGQRVLLIPRGDELRYSLVDNLAELRKAGVVAGMGKGWFDAEVWRANRLPVVEQEGEWRQLYPMLAARNRGVDYFPRGLTEVVAEARLHPELAIEPHLLLVYARDFVFYLPRSRAELKPIIEAALRQAEKSGLQQRLINEYFGAELMQLQLDKRVRIPLQTPN